VEEGIVVVGVALNTSPRASLLAVMLNGKSHQTISITRRYPCFEPVSSSRPKLSKSVEEVFGDIVRRIVVVCVVETRFFVTRRLVNVNVIHTY
jgi:hypothetical protein